MSFGRVAAFGLGMALAVGAQAGVITNWTGGVDSDFGTAGNWSAGAPLNNDWQYDATFTENAPANKTPNNAANRSVGSLVFNNSVGWTLSGSQLTLRSVSSSGVGANNITAPIKSVYSNYTWTVGTGNTLNFMGGIYQNEGGGTINFTGGGTMYVNNRIDGWSGSLKLNLLNGILKINGATPYINGGSVRISSADGILQLKTTVAAATALIGSKIIDVNSLGLGVTDIGGGYVQIAVIPEPASLALLAGGAGLIVGFRRRQGV